MRVVFVTPLYPPEPGGPATYAKLIEAGLPTKGIELEILKFKDVRHLPKLVRHLTLCSRILKAGKKADLIFVQDTVSCGLPAAVAANILGKPLVVRVPGDYAWEQSYQRYGVTKTIDEFQTSRKSFVVQLLVSLQRWVVKQARLVIVPSQYFKKVVSMWGIPSERISAIYHGEQLTLNETTASVSKQKFRMVSVGRMVPWKGFAFLIELLAELPEWELVLIGSGPDLPFLTSLAQKQGVASRVIFTGALPQQEARAWEKSADVFVLNTSFESFSFQVLEMMLLEVPIIATNIGSLPELIENPKEGLLLQENNKQAFKEALESVKSEPEAWRERVRLARVKADSFSVSRMIEETAEALQKAI